MVSQPRDADVLFRRHAPELARFLVKRGVPRQEVEDLVQEVFLVAHRLGGYQPGAARPFTWLAEIAVRRASSEARRRRRRADVEPELPEMPARTPATEVEEWEAINRLGAALMRLAESDRELLVQCAVEDRPQRRIAAGLGIPLATVYVRLHTARRRLARALADPAAPSPRLTRPGA